MASYAQTGSGPESDVPPGFEDLLRPQTNVVDVYFGGERVGTAVATFQPGKLRFEDPAAVVELLPGIEDPAAVAGALGGDLETHAARVCPGSVRRPGCGTLEPEIAGIIFDDTRFRADVFVNPRYLATQPAVAERFLPSPRRDWSFVQFSSAALSAADGREVLFNFRNRAILGIRSGRLITDLALTNDEVLVDALLGEWDGPGRHYAAGFFRTRGLNLLGQVKIAGVRFDTDTRTRIDLEQAEGSPLVVFLPRRSQVEILREGRLLSAGFYEAGNQQLDTSGLPEGAYTVTIRIREPGGAVREEQRFFIKSTELPPTDQPLFVVEAGALVDDRDTVLPEFTDEPVVRLGARHRLRDWWGVGGNLFATDDQAIGEANTTFLTRYGRLNLVGLAGTDGDFGFGLSLQGNVERLNYSLNVRRIWSTDDGSSLIFDPDDFDPIQGSSTQIDVRLSYPLGSARIGFLGVLRQNEGADTTYAFGPTVFWPFWRRGPWRAELDGSATVSNDATVVLMLLRLRYDRSRYRGLVEAGAQANLPRNGTTLTNDRLRGIGRAEVGYRRRDLDIGEFDVFAGAGRDIRDGFARVGGDYRGRFGRANVEGEQRFGADGPDRLASANYSVGIAVNREGVAMGGRRTYDSALIVRLVGSARQATFDVLIDNTVRGRVRAGQSNAFFLRPYERYDVKLRPVDQSLTNFDAGARTISLFPGTVETLVWRVDRVVVVYGRIVDTAGEPLRQRLIDGVVGTAETDEQGYFQAEIGGERELRIGRGDEACRVTLPDIPAGEEIVGVGTLACR